MKKLIPILLLAFISQICYAEDTPNGNNAEIIIRDINGNIIYDVVDTISNGYVILLPEFVSAEMYRFELVYSENQIVLYF